MGDQPGQALQDQLVQDLLDQQVQALQDQQSLPQLVAQLFLLLLFLLPQQSRNQQNQQNRVADKLKEDNLAIRYIGSNIQIHIYIYMNNISHLFVNIFTPNIFLLWGVI